MIAKSLSEAVYNQIFPGGLIPLRCKDNISAIDARIKEIADLAEGKIVEGMNRRLGKADSQALTEQIFQLRDSCEPPMSYREIMRRLGNVISADAARNRYDDAMKVREAAELPKDPSLPGVEGAQELARAHPRGTPESEEPQPAKPGPEPKSIPRAALDDKIWKAWKGGKSPDQISDELCAEGLYYGRRSIELRLRQQGADL